MARIRGLGRLTSPRVWLAAAGLLSALTLAACASRVPNVLVSPAPSQPSNASPAPTPTPTPATSTPMPVAGKVLPPPSGAYLGVFAPPAPFERASVDTYVSQAQKPVAIVMWYQPWAVDNRSLFDPAVCWSVLKAGAVPMITWEPWDPGTNAAALTTPADQPGYRLRSIIDGRYDSYIRSWATQIRDFGGPIMLRPMHEMNGFWYPWGGTANGNVPYEYLTAWRHIHDIFQAEGASNVTWVWSVNALSLPKEQRNGWDRYYPGDAFVDWLGVSGFNWGNTAGQHSWQTFDQQFEPVLEFERTLGKPVCIAEMGSTELGGNKAAWLRDAYSRIRAHDEIRGVVYYDARDNGIHGVQDWRIDTSSASMLAFRAAVASQYFVSTPPDAVTRWLDSLSPEQRAYLESLQPVY